MIFSADTLRRIAAVAGSPSGQFVELAHIAELEPGIDFRGTNLCGIDLRDQNLAGFDFTESDLTGADLRMADLRETLGLYYAILKGAAFDEHTRWPILRRRAKIMNRAGLGARPSALIVMFAEQFVCSIDISKDGQTVPARSIMGIMMLGAGEGSPVELLASGVDAREAIEQLEDLIKVLPDRGIDGLSEELVEKFGIVSKAVVTAPLTASDRTASENERLKIAFKRVLDRRARRKKKK